MSVLSLVGAWGSLTRTFESCYTLGVSLFCLDLLQALKVSNYDAEPMLHSSGISISNSFTQIDGHVLPAPKVSQLSLLLVCVSPKYFILLVLTATNKILL